MAIELRDSVIFYNNCSPRHGCGNVSVLKKKEAKERRSRYGESGDVDDFFFQAEDGIRDLVRSRGLVCWKNSCTMLS